MDVGLAIEMDVEVERLAAAMERIDSRLAGVDQIERARKRFPNFDVAKFREDLRVCLQASLQ